MSGTLYFTKHGDPHLQQILIAARFTGQPLPAQEIPKKYDPLTLLTPDGPINQPNAILLFVAGDQLAGQNQSEKLQVAQWFEHFNMELHPLLKEIYEQLANEREQNKEKFDYSLKELLRELELVNNHLKIRTFMVGDSVTVIDISLATQLQTAFKNVLTEENRRKVPNVVRWFTYVRSTGPFQAVLGDLILCQKEGQKQVAKEGVEAKIVQKKEAKVVQKKQGKKEKGKAQPKAEVKAE